VGFECNREIYRQLPLDQLAPSGSFPRYRISAYSGITSLRKEMSEAGLPPFQDARE